MVKHTQTILRLLPRNFLSVFDHFVGLALKGLTLVSNVELMKHALRGVQQKAVLDFFSKFNGKICVGICLLKRVSEVDVFLLIW